MSSEVKLTWNGDKFIQAARVAAEKSLAVACEEPRRQMKINLSGKSPSKPGDYPGADTGRLSRELFNRSIGPFERNVGSDLKYGRYLEYGAVITPKKVKYLPVPLNKAARRMLSRLGGESLRTQKLKLIIKRQRSAAAVLARAGTTYGRPTSKRRAGRRTYKGRQLSLFRSSGPSTLLLVTTTGTGKVSKAANAPAFVLKKRVVLQARPWCYRTAVQTRDQFYARFEAEMKKNLAQAAGGAP